VPSILPLATHRHRHTNTHTYTQTDREKDVLRLQIAVHNSFCT